MTALDTAGFATAVTAADVVRLVEAEHVHYSWRLWLVDNAGVASAALDPGDWSPAESSVDYHGDRPVPFSARFAIARPLLWSSQRVRLGVTVSAPSQKLTRSWDLGVWLLDRPQRSAAGHDAVNATDLNGVLARSIGATWTVDAGAVVLDAALALFAAAGVPASMVRVHPLAAGRTALGPLTWLHEDQNTFLRALTELLQTIGYRPPRPGRGGGWDLLPVAAPATEAPVYSYDAQRPLTATTRPLVAGDPVLDEPLVPNHWTFVPRRPSNGLPFVGNGIYRRVNQSEGPSSVDARGGLVFDTRVELEAANDASLREQGDAYVVKAQRGAQTLSFAATFVPEHWCDAVFGYADTRLGIPAGARFAERSWSLSALGADVQRTAERVG